LSDIRGLTDLRVIVVDEQDLEKVTIRLPPRYLQALDFLVKVDDFPSRSEAIRSAVRDLIYQRVETVMDKLKKLSEADRTLAELEEFERKFLNK
jgi:antitoxin ParD1/3/4